MSTDLDRDSGGDERIRKWIARTIEVESIDRFVIRHDTGAEVATLRADDGGAFERTERQLDELASPNLSRGASSKTRSGLAASSATASSPAYARQANARSPDCPCAKTP